MDGKSDDRILSQHYIIETHSPYGKKSGGYRKLWSAVVKILEHNTTLYVSELPRLLDKAAENKVDELRFTDTNFAGCTYHCRDHKIEPISRVVWGVKSVVFENCVIGLIFLLNILNDKTSLKCDDCNVDISACCGKNSIEEVRIIGCLMGSGRHIIDKRTIDGKTEYGLRREILRQLENNYCITLFSIIDDPRLTRNDAVIDRESLNMIQREVDECELLDRQINLILDRNKRGHKLCQSAIYNVLLIKKYRNTGFDLLGRDIILIICGLLLNSKGTCVWHQLNM